MTERNHPIPTGILGGRKCWVCGRWERDLTPTLLLELVESYSVGCTYCGKEIEFNNRTTLSNGIVEPQPKDGSVECGGCGEKYEASRIVSRRDPESVLMNPVWGSKSELNQIADHHTSYEPERTIFVCNICHGLIHHRDGYMDGLEPDISRKEWENDAEVAK